jgi:hypothetical protein
MPRFTEMGSEELWPGDGLAGVALAPGAGASTSPSFVGDFWTITTVAAWATPGGAQVSVKVLDTSGSPAGAGALSGLAVAPYGRGVYFVDDAANTLDLLH